MKVQMVRGRDQNLGFTLIELVVVMAIIAILTSLSVYNFAQARAKARDISRKNDLKALVNAMELYKNDRSPQVFPPTATVKTDLAPAYIKDYPVDPKYKINPGSWVDYTYTRNVTDALKYTLVACLENTGDLEKVAGLTCGPSGSGVKYQLTQP